MEPRASQRFRDPVWLAIAGLALVVPSMVGRLGGLRVVHDIYNTPKLLGISLAAFAGITALVVSLLRGRSRSIRFNSAYWWAFGFLVLAAASALAGVCTPYAFLGSPDRQGLLTFIVFVVLGFVSLQAACSASRVRSLAAVVALGGVPVAIIALLQVLGADPFGWAADSPSWMVARGISTFGNPDHLGGYLIFPLVLAPAWALVQQRPGRRLLGWAVFGLVGAAHVATLTRGAWFGGMLGVSVLAVGAWHGRHRLKIVDYQGIALGFFGIMAMLVRSGPSAARRAAEAFSVAGAQQSGRLGIWQAAIESIPERWLLGFGPDSFRFAYMAKADTVYSSMYADDAHNYLLMLGVTVGIPALIAVLVLVLSTLRQATSAGFLRGDADSRLPYVGWLGAVVGYCGYLLLGPSSAGATALVWVGIGVLLAPSAQEVAVRPRSSPVVALVAAWAVLLLGLGAVSTVIAADYHIQRSYEPPQNEILAHAQTAGRLMPWLPEYRIRTAELLGNRAVAAAVSGDEGAAGSAVLAIEAYDSVLGDFPWEYRGTVMYADVLSALVPVRGESAASEALEMAERALRIFPGGLYAKVAKSRALTLLGRTDEVISLLEEVWDEDPAYSEPGVQYAYALWLSGNRNQALDVVEQLQRDHPGDARVAGLAEYFEAATE